MYLMRYDHEAMHMFAFSPAACECNHANEVANPSKSLFDIQIAKQCLPQICSRIYVFFKINWFLVKNQTDKHCKLIFVVQRLQPRSSQIVYSRSDIG